MKPKLLTGIIEYERVIIDNPYHGMDYLVIKWCGVKFLKDFGPWKAEEKVYDLVFDPIEGNLVQYDNFGDDIKICKIEIGEKLCTEL